ncbi:MAG: COG1470 family protein [Candidatus Bathyarchaeia archaeon]
MRGWYHVFGEVNTTSTATFNYTVRITVTFQYSDGTSDSVLSSTLLELVGRSPGYDTAPFHIVLANSTKATKVSNYAIATESIPSYNYPYRQFTNSTTASVVGGKYRLAGNITNSGSVNATFVQVIATFYDIHNTVIYADWTYVEGMNLTAGESKTFELSVANTTNVEGYRLQVQCCEYEKPPTTPDFFLRPVMPIDRSITQGGSATYELRIIPNAALPYTNPISLTTTGEPEDSNIVFSPSNILPPSQPTKVIMNVATSAAIGVGVGDFMITVTASNGMVLRILRVTLTVNPLIGFGLSISPPSRTVSQGNQATYTVTVKSSGGFSSPVILSCLNIPQGSDATFNINPVTPTSTGNSSTMTISTSLDTDLGNFTFEVCGNGGSMSHCVNALIIVTPSTEPYFTLSIQPSQRTVMRGGSTTFNVVVTSHNGFNSDVSLALSGNPSGTNGTFTPSPVRPPPNSEVTSTLKISATADPSYGTYTITISGSSVGYPSKQVQATLIVSSLTEPDFGLYILPTTLSIVQNRSGVATVQVVSINNFADAVSLSLQNTPAGISYLISNPVVAPLPGGYVNTKLTVQTSSSTSIGNYTLTLRGESADKIHTVNFLLVVVAGPPTSIGKCIIATATYGSEVSPQVQFLRSFRDRHVLSTFAGREFMEAFNLWYYSFSPQIASWLSENPPAKESMKVMLIPLLGILHLSERIYGTFTFAPEPAIIMAGVVASFLIGLTYLWVPGFILLKICSFKSCRRLASSILLIWAASLIILAVGVATMNAPMVMVTSSSLVLCTVTIGSLTPPMAMLKITWFGGHLSRNRWTGRQ